MRQFRLVVLLPLLAVAGCYNDAPSQSTLPQLQYASGPPGGAIDPGYGYRQDADPAYGAGEPPAADVEAPEAVPSAPARTVTPHAPSSAPSRSWSPPRARSGSSHASGGGSSHRSGSSHAGGGGGRHR